MSEKGLDQFFTKQEVVEKILQKVEFNDYDLIIEPSAGDGAFPNICLKKRQLQLI